MSEACGERVLVRPALSHDADALIVAPGFSCRHQIADVCAGRETLSLPELLTMAG